MGRNRDPGEAEARGSSTFSIVGEPLIALSTQKRNCENNSSFVSRMAEEWGEPITDCVTRNASRREKE
jgi:hypothetical protein